MLILVLINIQFSKNVIFNFEKFNWSNSLPTTPQKNPNKISHPPLPAGGIPPPLNAIWKTLWGTVISPATNKH